MEYFLVFMLGVALAIVSLFVARPHLFTRSEQDFSYFGIMLEEAVAELEEKHSEFLREMEEQKSALLELQRQLLTESKTNRAKSPKVLAVLELVQGGLEPETIAKRLGMGIGEVELILELEKEWKSLAENE